MESIHYLARFNGEHVSKSGVSTDRVEKEEERRGERERVRKNGTRGGDGRESSRYPSNMRENLRLANENSAESTLFLPSPLPSPFVHLDYFAKSPISKARQFRPAQFSIHHPPVFVYFERVSTPPERREVRRDSEERKEGKRGRRPFALAFVNLESRSNESRPTTRARASLQLFAVVFFADG